MNEPMATDISIAVRRITDTKGAWREKNILANAHHLEPAETWNNEHKVIHVISDMKDPTGHADSYSVDLVTRKICG